MRQLGAVTAGELRPTRRIMPEPFAQLWARRDSLSHRVNAAPSLRNPRGQKPVHQDARAVIPAGWIVDPFDPDVGNTPRPELTNGQCL